jgi:hypothetical protein
MPDHAAIAGRDELEALRRLPAAAGGDGIGPVAVQETAANRPPQGGLGARRPPSSAFQVAVGRASFVAMQRLAGNQAMLQALGRSRGPGLLELPDELGEPTAAGGAAPAEAAELPGLAGAASGAPGGGAPPGPPNALAGLAASGGAARSGAATIAGGAAGALGAGLATGGATVGAAAGALSAGLAAGGPATTAGSGADAAAQANGPGGGTSPGPVGATRSRRSEPPPITAGGGGAPRGRAAGGPSAGPSSTPATGGPGQAPGAGATGASIAAPRPVPTGATAGIGAGGTLDANTAKTGIDWNQMLSDFGPPARTVLEIGRLIPGWGLLAGLASDSLSFASDLSSIPTSQDAGLATDLVIFRNVVNILNNGLGHVLYVNQLIQDGLAGSVVGAEFTPLTAAVNEVLSGIKVALDEVQMGTDIVVEVEALYRANHAPDSAEAEKWRTLADGYAANILGDVVNTILDLISLSSAGAANTAPIEEAKLPLTLAGAFLEHAAPNIISTINNILGVWLGGLVTTGRQAGTGGPAAGGAGPGTTPATGAGPAAAPTGAGASAAPAIQRLGEGLPGGADGGAGSASSLRDQALVLDMASGFIDVEAPQARATYDGINVVIEAFEAYADDQIAQIDAVVGALSGGKSAFQVIRDAVKAGLDDMNAKLAMAQQLGETATNAKANTASISAACASVLAGLDALAVPSVRLPTVDLGEGVLASAASAVANTAGEAANAVIELAISGVSAALDTAKDAVRGPIQELRDHADRLGEWLAILATKCTEMVATLNQHIASFSEGLGHCNNVEDVIDLIIGQVSDLTGMPRFTVQDLRNTWNGVGPSIDQFAALGPQLHERAAALRAQAAELDGRSQGGPTFALPAGPPPNSAGGEGPGVGAAA